MGHSNPTRATELYLLSNQNASFYDRTPLVDVIIMFTLTIEMQPPIHLIFIHPPSSGMFFLISEPFSLVSQEGSTGLTVVTGSVSVLHAGSSPPLTHLKKIDKYFIT